MASDNPDLWFSYVRSHRLMIREVEQRLAKAGLPTYAWYDTQGWKATRKKRAECMNSRMCW